MALYVNGSEIENVYAGGQKIDRVYANGTLVYESTIYVAKPTVTGAYTYNGGAQSAAISGYDSTAMTMSGTASATDAGVYHVYFELNKGYAWADGTTSKLGYTWNITKKSVAVPTLSTTSFAWVEGSTHTVTVSGLDATYVNQSGTTSIIDTTSNVPSRLGSGTSYTITWSLKNTASTQWADGTIANKTGTWPVVWKDGTSHYKNDVYCFGWSSGKVSAYGCTANFGSASQPYIRISPDTNTAATIYVNDTSLTAKGIHAIVMVEVKESDARYRAKVCLRNVDSMGLRSWSDSTATQTTSGAAPVTLYGKTPNNTSWDMTTMYAGVIKPAFISSEYTKIETLYWRIYRIWHD